VLHGLHTSREPDRDFYMAFNAWREPLNFLIPGAPQGRPWRRVVDTALASPLDIVGLDEGPVVGVGTRYAVAPFSVVVLIGEGASS
jgi:glycogen operon protein